MRDIYWREGYKTGVSGDDWVWLTGLLQNGTSTTSPTLERIEIVSPDVPYVEDDPEIIRDGGVPGKVTAAQSEAAKVWKLPESVMSLAGEVGVELSVVLRRDWGADYLYR
jgi:hypothetical protein